MRPRRCGSRPGCTSSCWASRSGGWSAGSGRATLGHEGARMRPGTICLHGPESTGKSSIAPALAARYGGVIQDEYGRDYAETHGTNFTMDDLVAIAVEHDRRTRALLAA